MDILIFHNPYYPWEWQIGIIENYTADLDIPSRKIILALSKFISNNYMYIYLYTYLFFDEVDYLGELLLLQDNNFRDSISDLSYVSHDTCQTNIDTNTCTNQHLDCICSCRASNYHFRVVFHLLKKQLS